MSLPCIHIYADAKGESHFGDTTIYMTISRYMCNIINVSYSLFNMSRDIELEIMEY